MTSGNKTMQLFLYPLTNRAIFPYQMVHMRMYEDQYDIKEFNSLCGLITRIEGDLSRDNPHTLLVDRLQQYSRYGTLVKITNEETGFVRGLLNKEQRLRSFRILSGLAFARFRIVSLQKKEPYMLATVEVLPDPISKEIQKDLGTLVARFKKEAALYYSIVLRSDEVEGRKYRLEQEKSLHKLLYNFISQFEATLPTKLYFLQLSNPKEKLSLLLEAVSAKTEQLKVTHEIEEKVRQDLNKDKEVQPKAQLSKRPSYEEGLKEIYENADVPLYVKEALQKESKKLNSQREGPEKALTQRYIQTLLEIPWAKFTVDNESLANAKTVLNRDHAGLQKVKNRVLQYLSIKFLKGNARGTILCLHGPPGVGKTSIVKSIAEALGRSFHRISLGGIHDQAQIRGHRRTYVGALPGMIVQALIKCKSSNPVILLDQIDKVTRSIRGDPSSALLQVLDPSQNSTFTDHYVGLPVDLSRVIFVATANQTDTIQPPLLDRMQLLEIIGYTSKEKHQIAMKYLVPKQIGENGLSPDHIEVKEESVKRIIKKYTFEAGVRQLEQKIAAVCRFVARKFLENKQNNQVFVKALISQSDLQTILGPQLIPDSDIKTRVSKPGVAIGMAWTPAGGRILLVQTSKAAGKGRIQLTGNLGNVMKESVKTVLAYVKSRLVFSDNDSSFKRDYFQTIDIHVHFPSAATPKDGPSAGVTIASALISLILGVRCKNFLSMTGELSLTGFVLPVGGVKEKVIAAYEGGMTEVIIPKKNKKDLKEIPEEVLKKLKIYEVSTFDEVLRIALNEPDIDLASKL